MNNFTRFSTHGSLILVGRYIQAQAIWEQIEKHVKIPQKTIVHRPIDKLKDAFINILAGGNGITEINTRVRPDENLQRAFGRQGCAEQSGVSTTLNRSTQESIQQMREAMKEIYQRHGQAIRHNYRKTNMLLDIDMTGMPAGRQGEGVSKGFFSGSKNRRGRQLGRITATEYKEVVIDKLYPGKVQLERSFQTLVLMAEEILLLTSQKRKGVILRADGGGGRDADIDWALERGYSILTKVHNWKRAHKLAQTVITWTPDPHDRSREYGWVETPHAYRHETKQVVLRKLNKRGEWQYRALVTNLPIEEIFSLARRPLPHRPTVHETAFAIVRAYDFRGGGVETSIKECKQGLGITKRNKKNFHAQELLVLLAQLAYNLIVWLRNLMAVHVPFWLQFGIQRMVRDAFSIPGKLVLDAQGHILELSLNEKHPLSTRFVRAFSFICDDLVPNLRKI
jgi:hypothetical protein